MPLRERIRPFLRGGRATVGWQQNDMYAEREARTERAQPTALRPSAVHTVSGTLIYYTGDRAFFALADPLDVEMDVAGAVFLWSTEGSDVTFYSALYVQEDAGATFSLLPWTVVSHVADGSGPPAQAEVFVRLEGSLPRGRPFLIASDASGAEFMGQWDATTYGFRLANERFNPTVPGDPVVFPSSVEWSSLALEVGPMLAVNYISTATARSLGLI